MATLHVVQYSGGIESWAAARRVIAEHGPSDVVLLFADTLVEDPDLYRFLDQTSAQFGIPVTVVADGRTPFEVYQDRRFLGNSLIAPCSKFLKQIPCRTWLEANAEPDNTILYVGIDHEEGARRTPGIVAGWAPWKVRFPMNEPPYLSKQDMFDLCENQHGIRVPEMYKLGFAHNNCGGVCVRAGQKHWKHLHKVHPARYAAAEAAEQRMRDLLGKPVSILKRRVNGVSEPLTLAQLREETEAEELERMLADLAGAA